MWWSRCHSLVPLRRWWCLRLDLLLFHKNFPSSKWKSVGPRQPAFLLLTKTIIDIPTITINFVNEYWLIVWMVPVTWRLDSAIFCFVKLKLTEIASCFLWGRSIAGEDDRWWNINLQLHHTGLWLDSFLDSFYTSIWYKNTSIADPQGNWYFFCLI